MACLQSRRSREGAWIEISYSTALLYLDTGRSREGAWIEIDTSSGISTSESSVAPVRERGLK